MEIFKVFHIFSIMQPRLKTSSLKILYSFLPFLGIGKGEMMGGKERVSDTCWMTTWNKCCCDNLNIKQLVAVDDLLFSFTTLRFFHFISTHYMHIYGIKEIYTRTQIPLRYVNQDITSIAVFLAVASLGE